MLSVMKHCPSTLTIGVSGTSAQTKSVRSIMKQIRDEGGKPVFLASGNLKAAVQDMARIQALVVMGNDRDIDPKSYLHHYPKNDPRNCIHPQTKSELLTPKGKARARYEEMAIRHALTCGMPLLGICGGMQRINVLCGGTLHQHIPDLVGCEKKHMQHKQGIAPHIPVVPILIKDKTMLAAIATGIGMASIKGTAPHCAQVIMENSMHHQSVDRIGEHLRVCALTDTVRMKDGTNGYLAEAIETDPDGAYAGQFILGVQWHPEFGASSLGQKIVQNLITAARQFSRTRKGHRAIIEFKRITSIQAARFHAKKTTAQAKKNPRP